MYNKIVNPITGEFININSNLGKKILDNYLQELNQVGYGRKLNRKQINMKKKKEKKIKQLKLKEEDRERHGIYNPKGKICVIGDIHGDYGALISALTTSGLITPSGTECDCIESDHSDNHNYCNNSIKNDLDESKKSTEINRWVWIGNNTHLVILGDMVDRLREQDNKYINTHTFGEFKFEEEIIQRVLNNFRNQKKKKMEIL